MKARNHREGLSRRDFFRSLASLAGGVILPSLAPTLARARMPRPSSLLQSAPPPLNDLFWVRGIPDQPFDDPARPNAHLGVESLLYLMADQGLKFYRSGRPELLCGPSGLIAPDDVVLIKVNAQWKYRGAPTATSSAASSSAILDHPDGFRGEVVIFENGQGRGSLACDTSSATAATPASTPTPTTRATPSSTS